jgi:mannosyltransferase
MEDLSPKRALTLLLVILALGLSLRLYKLDSKGIWYDELHSIIPTDPTNSLASVIEYCKTDQPPAYFLTLYFWYKVFPYNEASGKVLGAIIGVLGILGMYFLGKEVGGRNAGLAVAFLTAGNIFLVYYSQELRFYGLLFLMASLSCLFFIRFIKSPILRNQIFLVITTTLLLYTHYFGLVVALTEAIIFLIIGLVNRRGIRFFLKGLACAAFVLLAFLPWIPIIFQDLQINSFWIADPGPLFFIDYFRFYFAQYWGKTFRHVISWTFFLVLLYYFWTLLYRAKKGQRVEIDHFVIIGWGILTLLIPYLYTVYRMPMLLDRYTIITLPAMLLAVALGWVYIKNVHLKILIVLIFVVSDARIHYVYFTRYQKSEWRELAFQIIQENKNAYPVLSQYPWHWNYFFRKFKAPEEVQPMQNLSEPDWLKKEDRIWIIAPQSHLLGGQPEILNANFQVEKEIQTLNANAVLYVRKHP